MSVVDRYHALARGNGSRLLLLLLNVCLRSGSLLLLFLQDRLISSDRFTVSEVASVHVLSYRRGSRPLLLHVGIGKRCHSRVWVSDYSPLICLLDVLSARGAVRL